MQISVKDLVGEIPAPAKLLSWPQPCPNDSAAPGTERGRARAPPARWPSACSRARPFSGAHQQVFSVINTSVSDCRARNNTRIVTIGQQGLAGGGGGGGGGYSSSGRDAAARRSCSSICRPPRAALRRLLSPAPASRCPAEPPLSRAMAPGAAPATVLALAIWSCLAAGVLAQANVGCLFSAQVCDESTEWCYDDYAFGRCLPQHGPIDQESFYRFELLQPGLHVLQREMEHLFSQGYRWSHAYTQCVLQALLADMRSGLGQFDRSLCNPMADQDLEAALKVVEGDEQEQMDQGSLARVAFTPSASDPHPEFADEVYFPPLEDEDVDVNVVEVESAPGLTFYELPASAGTSLSSPEVHLGRAAKRSPRARRRLALVPDPQFFAAHYNTPDGFRHGQETRDMQPLALGPPDAYEQSQFEAMAQAAADARGQAQVAAAMGLLPVPLAPLEVLQALQPLAEMHRRAPEVLQAQLQPPPPPPASALPLSEELRRAAEQFFLETTQEQHADPVFDPERAAGYSEGGLVFAPPPGEAEAAREAQQEAVLENGLNRLLDEYGALDLGFKRRERLDVKKPGPPFATNNFAFRDRQAGSQVGQQEEIQPLEQPIPDNGGVLTGTVALLAMPTAAPAPPPDPAPVPPDDGPREEEGPEDQPYDDEVELEDEESFQGAGDAESPPPPPPPPPARPPSVVLDEDVEIQEPKRPLQERDDSQRTLPRKKEAVEDEREQQQLQQQLLQQQQQQQEEEEEVEAAAAAAVPESTSLLAVPPREPPDEPLPAPAPALTVGEVSPDALGPAPGRYDHVDTSYVYIKFKDRSIHNWQDGTRIVAEVARLLGVEPGAFSNARVDNNEVAFKVENNSKGLNASDVPNLIDGIKNKLRAKLGVEVTSAGIGNKTKLPPVLVARADARHELYVAAFLVCGALAAILVAGAVLFVVRRHARSRRKLQALGAQDSEASKDYQDLCRVRMANKGAQEKPEPVHVGQGGRIASLSRESEGSNNSPSSRSSTSSWSEEPALTNMDISTGHMVLSYMEDHLKNKDRLDQEWVALCAYEAEPCSTTIARETENARKNRNPDFLPYDHSRVVLNDLANISGSDYINASTITDHDPRNPAYIATQGPLPHTAPDFWQMVWEQGSVVMVMLTRLTDAGTAMCDRYWPKEGSELYHIYEVHLVSEHIWCDDYLVRSFYLKNLKTGETRTVTQFHFVSWPDAGVPSSTKALLEFRRKVNKSYRGRSCPIVVHCSDGVGRTGTYCLIDMVLNRMAKGAKEIDIAATLEHIRDQRPAMVRTKQQFEFSLMAVAEEVHAILKALPSQQQAQVQPPALPPPPSVTQPQQQQSEAQNDKPDVSTQQLPQDVTKPSTDKEVSEEKQSSEHKEKEL